MIKRRTLSQIIFGSGEGWKITKDESSPKTEDAPF
jgi:hypothetical protein